MLSAATKAASQEITQAPPESDRWAHCRSSDTCELTSAKLADQTSDPFLFLGRVIDRDAARWRQYAFALWRFPDVRSCLVKSERSAEIPNLLLLDWDRTGTGSGAEVCIFRIMRSLSSPEDVENWLAVHQFSFRGRSRRFSSSFEAQFPEQPVTGLTAVWPNEKYRELNPNLLARVTGFEWLLSYQLVIGFREADRVVSVSVVTPSK